MNFKRLAITDLKIEIPRLASKKVLTAAFNSAGALRWVSARVRALFVHVAFASGGRAPRTQRSAPGGLLMCTCLLLLLQRTDVSGKFAASAWGKKLAARSAKAATTDLDRYRAMVAKTKRSRLVRKAVNKLKKSA
jgi:hypothetical protein